MHTKTLLSPERDADASHPSYPTDPNGGNSMQITESSYEPSARPNVTWSQIIGTHCNIRALLKLFPFGFVIYVFSPDIAQGGSIGNVLEWYDFISFGMLAPQIGDNFFPSDSNLEMLETYSIFAGAFVMRPIGGVIFGAIGDKLGRKRTLQISVCMMFMATFTMGCLPTYKSIGSFAPMILTALRLFQGLSAGGQLVGSALFLIESAPPRKRGCYGAVTILTVCAGALMSSLVVALLNDQFSEQEMNDFGWRIPFLSSFVVAIFALISQHKMRGSHEFLSAVQHGKIVENPVYFAVKYYWRSILFIVFSLSTWCAGLYMMDTFLPIYLEETLKVGDALLTSTAIQLLRFFIFILGGYLADCSYGAFLPFKLGAFILCLSSYPLYYWMHREYVIAEEETLWPFITTGIVTGFGLGLGMGSMMLVMVSAVGDVAVRMSALGIGYNLCQAAFGGTAPMIGDMVSKQLDLSYVGAYLSILSAVSLITVCFMERRWRIK